MTDQDQSPQKFQMSNFAKEAQKYLNSESFPPVHLWHPEFCGDIDMRINRDGSWDYMGSPISRIEMVKLFSRIIRLDSDGKYYMVTPVEKVGITVVDAPFIAAEMEIEGKGEGQVITFRSNLDEYVKVGKDNPIIVEFDEVSGEPSPYVIMRKNLKALISRPVYYQMAELVVEHEGKYGIWSDHHFYPLGDLSE